MRLSYPVAILTHCVKSESDYFLCSYGTYSCFLFCAGDPKLLSCACAPAELDTGPVRCVAWKYDSHVWGAEAVLDSFLALRWSLFSSQLIARGTSMSGKPRVESDSTEPSESKTRMRT